MYDSSFVKLLVLVFAGVVGLIVLGFLGAHRYSLDEFVKSRRVLEANMLLDAQVANLKRDLAAQTKLLAQRTDIAAECVTKHEQLSRYVLSIAQAASLDPFLKAALEQHKVFLEFVPPPKPEVEVTPVVGSGG